MRIKRLSSVAILGILINSYAHAGTDCFLSTRTNQHIVIEARNIESMPKSQIRLMYADSRPIVNVVSVVSDDSKYKLIFDDSGIRNGSQVRTEVTISIYSEGRKLLALGTSKEALKNLAIDVADQSLEARADGMIAGGLNLYCQVQH